MASASDFSTANYAASLSCLLPAYLSTSDSSLDGQSKSQGGLLHTASSSAVCNSTRNLGQ